MYQSDTMINNQCNVTGKNVFCREKQYLGTTISGVRYMAPWLRACTVQLLTPTVSSSYHQQVYIEASVFAFNVVINNVCMPKLEMLRRD